MKNDLYEPIEFFGKGSCPVCRKYSLVLKQTETLDIYIDKDGDPEDYVSTVSGSRIVCESCGYTGIVGEDYIKLEDGSYKYVTEAGRIYETNRMRNLPEKTHLHADANPFLKISYIF